MATPAAAQHNSVFRKSYWNLCAAGKPKKIALIAPIHPVPSLPDAKVKIQNSRIEELKTSQESWHTTQLLWIRVVAIVNT